MLFSQGIRAMSFHLHGLATLLRANVPIAAVLRFGAPVVVMTLLGVIVSSALAAPPSPSGEPDAIHETASGTTAETILSNQSDALRERLLDNKVVILQNVRAKATGGDGLIVGFVIFETEIERVYLFLSQTTRQIEYRPEITSIETLSWDDEGPIDRHKIRIVFNRFIYHLRWHLDPLRRTLWWELDKNQDNDLEEVYGRWELFPMEEGGTLGRFTASVDVGSSVPGFLQDYITRRNLPKTMENNRLWIDSGGTYRP